MKVSLPLWGSRSLEPVKCSAGLVLAVFTAGQALAQCQQQISVQNSTGEPIVSLTMSFAGFSPSISPYVNVEPDLPPSCPPKPLIAGDLLNTVFFNWAAECVDPGSTVTFLASSPEEIPVVLSGSWSDLDDNSFPIPGSEFVFSPDCNANCVADEIDISSGASEDENQNGVPDECDPATEIPVLTFGGGILYALLLAAGALRRLSSSHRGSRSP
jgi:hypothetical protein